MLHIIIGTKAQFIKMAPILIRLKEKNLQFILHDLCQHKSTTKEIINTFGLNDIPINEIVKAKGNISTIYQAVGWTLRVFKQILRKKMLKKALMVQSPHDIVLIHGDTLSTLYGAIIAKRLNLKVGLVEAGLTSGKVFTPFPEELVRRIVQRMAYYLFCPGIKEEKWLKSKLPNKCIINTDYNTGEDAVNYFSQHLPHITTDLPYCLVTIHRLETISNKEKLKRVVNYIAILSSEVEEIRFCLHPPTEHYLNKYKLKSHLLEIDNLSILPIQPYDKFLKLIVGAKFVITDGGSIQEECQTLNKLCIIFRSTTERDNGLLNNAVMTTFSATKDLDALNQLSPKVTKNDQDFKASDIIINSLESA